MIDLHSHVLPGLDDGAADLPEALAICRAAAAEGIKVLAGTPHVRFDHPTTPQEMESALELLQEAAAGIVRLVPGGELDLAELDRPRDELARFGLGGNPDYLLVETPYFGWPLGLGESLFRLRAAGITPVLAHPERNSDVQEHPELVAKLVAEGALVQLTAASIDGRAGARTKATAKILLERRLAHLIASDAHTASVRAIGMTDAVRTVDDGELARWLTWDVPQSIVEGTPLPPRPDRRRFRLRNR